MKSAARVVVVGITPGKLQAHNALAEAARQLRAGASVDEMLAKARRAAAFSGPMRTNLVAMLDCVGLHRWLRLPSCSDLFGSASQLLQCASVLPYPVFASGKHYNGSPESLGFLGQLPQLPFGGHEIA